jgi:hypothetical protein
MREVAKKLNQVKKRQLDFVEGNSKLPYLATHLLINAFKFKLLKNNTLYVNLLGKLYEKRELDYSYFKRRVVCGC